MGFAGAVALTTIVQQLNAVTFTIGGITIVG